MGANCGCFRPAKEEEISIQPKDPVEIERAAPPATSGWEREFNELMSSLPITSLPIKVWFDWDHVQKLIGKTGSNATISV